MMGYMPLAWLHKQHRIIILQANLASYEPEAIINVLKDLLAKETM